MDVKRVSCVVLSVFVSLLASCGRESSELRSAQFPGSPPSGALGSFDGEFQVSLNTNYAVTSDYAVRTVLQDEEGTAHIRSTTNVMQGTIGLFLQSNGNQNMVFRFEIGPWVSDASSPSGSAESRFVAKPSSYTVRGVRPNMGCFQWEEEGIVFLDDFSLLVPTSSDAFSYMQPFCVGIEELLGEDWQGSMTYLCLGEHRGEQVTLRVAYDAVGVNTNQGGWIRCSGTLDVDPVTHELIQSSASIFQRYRIDVRDSVGLYRTYVEAKRTTCITNAR